MEVGHVDAVCDQALLNSMAVQRERHVVGRQGTRSRQKTVGQSIRIVEGHLQYQAFRSMIIQASCVAQVVQRAPSRG